MKYEKDSIYILELCLSTGQWVSHGGIPFIPTDEKELESMLEIMRKAYIQTNYNNTKYRLSCYTMSDTYEF